MKLFVFGLGYSAAFFAKRQLARGHQVTGTVRSRAKASAMAEVGIAARVLGPDGGDDEIESDIATCDALLASVPPDSDGDPVLRTYARQIAAAPNLRWLGYLSTIGVYGDHAGGWIDEQTPVNPANERSHCRASAEQEWLALGVNKNVSVQIFRLAGIYGPGRNQLVQMAQGTARRVIKPGQVFNRIHVEDIARVLEASVEGPRNGAIYNVADNEPAPPQDVVAFAAQLCNRAPPPDTRLEDAVLTDMGRSFYAENKRVRNRLIHEELGVNLKYPTYREGLTALKAAGEGIVTGSKVDRLG